MKHLKRGRKLSRTRKQRKALLKTMLGNFILQERIKTTEAKAKELKEKVEKIISRAKKILAGPKGADLSQVKFLRSQLSRSIEAETLKKIAQRFSGRKGGYTRIVKIGQRRSDGAKMAVIELIKEETHAGKIS